MKTISHHKVDKEEHTTDVIADIFFWATITKRLRARGESQQQSIKYILDRIFTAADYINLQGSFLIVNHSYASYKYMKQNISYNINMMIIHQDNQLCGYPFVRQSFLNIYKYDIESNEESNRSIDKDINTTSDKLSQSSDSNNKIISRTYKES